MLSRFAEGFSCFFSGLELLRARSNLRYWSIIPLLIGALTLIVGGWATIVYMPAVVDWLLSSRLSISESSYGYLYYPLLVVVGILVIMLSVYLAYWVSLIIASPVYGILAEKTMHHLDAERGNLKALARPSLLKMVLVSIVKACFFAIVGAVLFITTIFFPGVNILASFFLFFVIATDSADYALEVVGYSFRQRLNFYRRYFVEFAGIACFIGLTLIVPGLILLLMPAAVIGSSALVYRKVGVAA